MFIDQWSPSESGPGKRWAAEHMRLQRLVSDLGTRLRAAQANQVDKLIVDALRDVASTLHVEYAILWQKSADHSSVVASHSWTQDAPEVLPQIPVSAFP